jgi:hypothetical protein
MIRKIPPAPTWWKLIARAIEIIDDEHQTMLDSFTALDGKIYDMRERRQVAKLARWLADARAELFPQSKRPESTVRYKR